jgi:inorganic pyrophosphatase
MPARLIEMPSFSDTGELNVIIETPMGSRNKYKYDEPTGMMSVDKVLPAGMFFSFNFGFIPSTRAEDDDPLDVLILLDHAVFPGCLVHSRLIGAIDAEQTDEDNNTYRNDRLLCVAEASRIHSKIKTIDDVSEILLHEIEDFFAGYNAYFGKTFKALGHSGPQGAREKLEIARMQFHTETIVPAGT